MHPKAGDASDGGAMSVGREREREGEGEGESKQEGVALLRAGLTVVGELLSSGGQAADHSAAAQLQVRSLAVG